MNLPQSIGFPGGSASTAEVKSYQRGTVTATNAGTGTVTVSAVNTARSLLLISVVNGYGAGPGAGQVSETIPRMKLTDSTTLTWNGGTAYFTGSANISSTIEWQLLEYK